MQQTLTHNFAHPLVDIVSLMLNADFLCQMMVDLGNRDVEVSVEPVDEDQVKVDMRRTVAADAPALIRPITGDWVKLHQQERWTGLANADDAGGEVIAKMTLDLYDKPASGAGRLSFRHDGEGGTICKAVVSVTCSVPLAAPLVEKMIIADSKSQLERQFAYLEGALGEDG